MLYSDAMRVLRYRYAGKEIRMSLRSIRTFNDNEEIGFRDVKFDEMMGGRSSLPEDFMEEKEREMCLEVFKEYKEMEAERY